MPQREIYKIACQPVIFGAFATDKEEIAGNFKAFNGYLYKVALGKLPNDGWAGHKAQALVGQQEIFEGLGAAKANFHG